MVAIDNLFQKVSGFYHYIFFHMLFKLSAVTVQKWEIAHQKQNLGDLPLNQETLNFSH